MLARGGKAWVAAAAVLAAVASAATATSRVHPLVLVLALPLPLLLLFYRDPDRGVGDHIVSPADGKVIQVGPVGGGQRVAIFMGPWDVHVNRAPCEASVASRTHRPGGHLPAFDKEAETNERMVWELDTAYGDIELVQIAGAVARRIVPYADPGDKLEKGQRIGMIRFGSRVDVVLPEGLEPLVEEGDRVVAGETSIADGA